MTGNVACHNHTLGGPVSDCIHCVRAQRDFLMNEVGELIKCLETPASKHRDIALAFIRKMKDRGVTELDCPATEYHLALLVKELRCD